MQTEVETPHNDLIEFTHQNAVNFQVWSHFTRTNTPSLDVYPHLEGDEIETGKDWKVVKSENIVSPEHGYGPDFLI